MTARRRFGYLLPGLIALVAMLVSGRAFSADETAVSALAGETHFHGIAVDTRDPERLYLATHHGLYLVGPDGSARRISQTRDDFMGFTPHPADPDVFYASGHPAGGGNLGVIVSRDGGATWSRLADGVGGPVDFHQVDVSRADPRVVYGVHDGLQRSTDGGRTWTRIGPVPDGIIDLAASSRDRDTIYAATRRGLLVSTDGGRRWRSAHESGRPATMVHAAPGGTLYVFIVGAGLARADETDLDWAQPGGGFGRSVVLHLAVGADAARRTLHAVTFDPESRTQALRVSRDGGRTWSSLGGEVGS